MQIKFLTALVLVGVYFTQVTFAQSEQTTVQATILDDLIAKAEQAIESFQSFIKVKIDDAIQTLNGYKVQVNNQSQVATQEAKTNLNEVVTGAQLRIDAIKQKAQQSGGVIPACLCGNEEDNFGTIFLNFLADEIGCITNEVDTALGIINDAIQLFVNDWDAVEQLPEQLQACGTGLISLLCINQLIVDIAELQVDLVTKIALKEIEVSAFVSGIEPTLEICAVSQVAKAGVAAAGIVADVVACATA